MTDVRELIERLKYCDKYGIFAAVKYGKSATYGEASDALSAALAREEALREALERAAMRFDMLAPLVLENKCALAVTKWANEARAAALSENTNA